MTNDKPLKNVMRSATFVIWSSLTLGLAGNGVAQERSWEFALTLNAYNSGYDEVMVSPDNGALLDATGNSFIALAPQLAITFRARQDLRLPLFLTVQGCLPLMTSKGSEVEHATNTDGTGGITYKTEATHNETLGRGVLGVEILPFLQPYVAVERSQLSSRRTGQLDGNDQGQFVPDANQDYTESVVSTELGFGIQGTAPLTINGDIRIRYDFGYLIPQTVSVSNTSFDAASFGQGTTGYTFGGRVQLDLPFILFNPFTDHDGYWTIGATFSKRHWNGDGRLGRTTSSDGQPSQTLLWPDNTMVKAGGFIGIGLFF